MNGGDASKSEQFTQATEAYRFLLDKDKRSQYDYFTTYSEDDATRAYEDYSEKHEDAAVDYQQFIRDMISEIKESKFNARFSILGGLFLMVIGTIATLFAYFSADPGENFTIMSGFMIIGGIGAVKSLFSYGSLLSKIKDYENDVWLRILGHKPTNKDEDYVSYNKIVHPLQEKIKSFLLVISVVICVVGMIFFYLDIQD